jgi:branched-chain amino acid transport system ATP-binding protein
MKEIAESCPILETSHLTKKFGGAVVASGINIRVPRGDIRCVIGPNGAGKSTFLKLVIGEYRASAGVIRFAGEDVTAASVNDRVRKGMSIKFQVPAVFMDLTVEQNLVVALLRESSDVPGDLERILRTIGLLDRCKSRACDLSHGQRQSLELGMCISIKPALILLDEPAAGLSHAETRKTGDLIRQFNESGMTFIVVEHDMAFVRQIAKSVSVLHLGAIFFEGSLEETVANDEVVRIYLGKK